MSTKWPDKQHVLAGNTCGTCPWFTEEAVEAWGRDGLCEASAHLPPALGGMAQITNQVCLVRKARPACMFHPRVIANALGISMVQGDG